MCYLRSGLPSRFSQTGAAGLDGVSDVAEIKVDSVALSDRQYASGQSFSSVTYDRLEHIPYNKWFALWYMTGL